MTLYNRRQQVTIILNVYDLSSSNSFLHSWGMGAYHSGVELNGREYSYGKSDGRGSGIFECEPRLASGCTFRESIELGSIEASGMEILKCIDSLRARYQASEYDILLQNCNHFCDDLASTLFCQFGVGEKAEKFNATVATKNGIASGLIPTYINRMAFFASYMRCLLPANLAGKGPVEGASSTQKFIPFAGNGRTLLDMNSANSSNEDTTEVPDDLMIRRQQLASAALSRMQAS